MHEYLIEQARDQVWCNPAQDNQHIIKPERISYGAGAIGQVFGLSRYISLPDKTNYYQVFQVGQWPPSLLGLIAQTPSWRAEKWFDFEEAMNQAPFYANIYTQRGLNMPRRNAFFMQSREKCLLLAVKVDKLIPANYAMDDFYFRFYSNAHLKQLYQATSTLPFIEVKFFKPLDIQSIMAVQVELETMKLRIGHTEVWVNGHLAEGVTLLTVHPGDIVELIYDASVKRLVTWTSDKLVPFQSTLDQKHKYLLHYDKSVAVNQIDFQDDIDVYIKYNKDPVNKIGYFYPKNLPNAMRMVTHRDYSLTGDYVTYISRCIVEDLGVQGYDFADFEVTLKIRQGGYNRTLIHDAHRIQELYRLPDANIVQSMSGVNSLVPQWGAAQLEASAYTDVMRARWDQVTIEKTEATYGYRSLSVILADTPTKTDRTGHPFASLKYELAYGPCTIYEYDADGKLLGVYLHQSGDDDYNANNANCFMIEALVGIGTDRPNDVFGRTGITIRPNCSFRVYQAKLDFTQVPAVKYGDWTDITGSTGKYEVINGVLNWIGSETDQLLLVRFDDNFLSYTFDTLEYDGTFVFSILQQQETEPGYGAEFVEVPRGDLQIWVNGYNLVRDIDYTVKYPYVSVNNFKYFKQPVASTSQTIHVRFMGFCDSDLKLIPIKSKGFVVNGALSNDRKHSVLKNKVLHISVNGCVYDKDEVVFFEDRPTWQTTAALNGTPYQINETIVPLKNFTKTDTYALLATDNVTDANVEAYMDQYLPPPSDEPISVAASRWRLVSPFISKLVSLCLNNSLTFTDGEAISDTQVLQICKPYEVLLEYDPVNTYNELPDTYVNITPTRSAVTVNVTRAQYRFLEAAVRLYCDSKVGLNNFITFTAP